MKTISTFSAPVPVMPVMWPAQRNKHKTSVPTPRRVQDPVPIRHYLEPLIGIAGKPNRSEILRAYFSSEQ